MLTIHVLVPEHPAPDHPANILPALAVAVSVTLAPELKLNKHVVPQLIPAGLLVTVPDPVPVLLIVNVNVGIGVIVKMNVVCLFTVPLEVPVIVGVPDTALIDAEYVNATVHDPVVGVQA